MRPKPLHGIRILDLTRLLPGPLASLHLADMGADVVKIEDPQAGDYARTLGPRSKVHAWLFLLANRNKRALRLDLKRAAGRDAFLELAADADVIIESFRPGVVGRLGVDFDTVREINPRIVYCAVTGYGQSGPYREHAGHDLNYCGYAGISDQIGPRGGAPVIPNFQIGDLVGGSLSAVMGILSAIVDAQRRGEGRYVDVAMTDCALAHTLFPLISLLDCGRTQPRGEDFVSGGLPCYGIYETADGRHMAVAALEEKFWTLCCKTLDRPDLAERSSVIGAEAEAVREEVAAVFRTRTQSEWVQRFKEVDCCVTPVLTMAETMHNEQILARNMVVTSEHPVDGSVTQFAFPVKFSDFEFSIDYHAPAPGEHSEEILAQAGFDAERIGKLRADGII